MFAEHVRFAVLHFEPQLDGAEWAAEISYSGPGWADLDGTLLLLIDGRIRDSIAGRGSEGNRTSSPGMDGDVMRETERLEIPDSLVARMARAHSVELRVGGASKVLDRWFNAEALASVRAMARRYGLAGR